MTPDQLRRVFTLARRISRSPALTQQLIGEIEAGRPGELLGALEACLDRVELSDLGVTESNWGAYFRPNSMTHTSVFETEEMSICFFALSKGAGLPLHDHPGMAAITQVMKGHLRFKLADLVCQEDTNLFTYHPVRRGELRAPAHLSLTPALSNLHQFLAMEHTILLDVFIPNYSPVRDVTYFLELSDTKVCGVKSACLDMRHLPYRGVALCDQEEM